ncbi:MAG: DUF4270 domain-containing protein [Flavobacteriaceae bacterium]|jgi:hypothetical protein|nr:DUF4270 domain-containing protein [Flavobacteriaceae bacterium]MCB0485955.1 DUF4270 domain-containing protein [Flavobacteriaceae bacterium]
MTKRFVNAVKTIVVFSLILMSVAACEKEFKDIGVGLVDNNLFETEKAIFDVIAYNVNVDSTRVDGNPQYLLGIYKNDDFGYLKASFVSQLAYTSSDFGDNVSIDAVILDIPYYATAEEDYSDGKPQFKLDSIIGDTETTYGLSVYELSTYLNSLEPTDPSKTKKYYSNENYTKGMLLKKLEAFKPNANDTVLYVERRFLDDDISTIDDRDTIKKTDLKPSIKIPLDTTFFRTHFVDQQDTGVFDSYQNFIEYFRGILIEPQGTDGSLMTLAMSDAKITVYYTNDILTDETEGNDLNGDGDTNDEDVPVRTKQSKEFTVSGIAANKYERDYTGSNALMSFNDANPTSGDEKLYIQGASGSMAVIELFKDVDLDEIRNENWLINEANLTFYIDGDVDADTKVPEQLFLYNYDYNSQMHDAISEINFTGNGGGGILLRDDDNNPIKYKFSITDYVSELLKEESDIKLNKLALKVFHSTDNYDPTVYLDTIINSNSWKPKGVVLKGNKILNTASDYNSRIKLEIFYTKSN